MDYGTDATILTQGGDQRWKTQLGVQRGMEYLIFSHLLFQCLQMKEMIRKKEILICLAEKMSRFLKITYVGYPYNYIDIRTIFGYFYNPDTIFRIFKHCPIV